MPVIGILRFVAPDMAPLAAAAAVRGGIQALEVTMNSQEPASVIRALRDELPGVAVGAGTVMSVAEARDALDAGAHFVVSPHLDEEIVRLCADAGKVVFPGALTPTEVYRAHVAGATMVKVFPAGPFGPEYIRALRGPFRQIDLLVTGGIDAGNIGDFLRAGARGAAVGGNLFPAEMVEAETMNAVEQEARRLVNACGR